MNGEPNIQVDFTNVDDDYRGSETWTRTEYIGEMEFVHDLCCTVLHKEEHDKRHQNKEKERLCTPYV